MDYQLIELAKAFTAIASAPGVNDNVKKECNTLIEKLLAPISVQIRELTAASSGIIT